MRPLVRLTLRHFIRPLHSPIVRPPHKSEHAALVLGASLAVAGYVGWRIAATDQHISLDALPKQHPQTATLSSPGEREANVDLALSPNSSVKQGSRQVDIPVEKDGNRHSNGDKGTEYPPDSKPKGPAQDDNIERSPKDSVDEEEGEGQGAYNPVTGEINWDCPCLGGMAHGPCGQQFREAFSCFVYSEQEPKGIDCIEKFKNMQDCVREHPDIYGEEIADDEEDGISDPSSSNQTATEEPSASVQAASSEPSRSHINETDRTMSREKQ